MYKFYSFPDHDTEVVSHSSSPAFNNTKHFPLSMGQHLDHYLRTEVRENIASVPSFFVQLYCDGPRYIVLSCDVSTQLM